MSNDTKREMFYGKFKDDEGNEVVITEDYLFWNNKKYVIQWSDSTCRFWINLKYKYNNKLYKRSEFLLRNKGKVLIEKLGGYGSFVKLKYSKIEDYEEDDSGLYQLQKFDSILKEWKVI